MYESKHPTWAIVLGVILTLTIIIGFVLFFVKTNQPVHRSATTLTADNGATLTGTAGMVGASMTDGFPPPVPAPPPPAGETEWFTERIVLLVCAAAIVAGSFGPWLIVQSGFGSIAANGMDGDGKLTALGGVLVALFVFIRKYIGAVVVGRWSRSLA